MSVADCLETIDEIGTETAETFKQAGGDQFHFVPSRSTHSVWIDAMTEIVREESAGWVTVKNRLNFKCHDIEYYPLARIK
jgi:protoporphyrin/coproporphyrin ferrochelatase